jgi:hypothetical protein
MPEEVTDRVRRHYPPQPDYIMPFYGWISSASGYPVTALSNDDVGHKKPLPLHAESHHRLAVFAHSIMIQNRRGSGTV